MRLQEAEAWTAQNEAAARNLPTPTLSLANEPEVDMAQPHKSAIVGGVLASCPGGKSLLMADIIGAVAFLIENEGVNGQDLVVDHGRPVM
jgi:hypothetical protein